MMPMLEAWEMVKRGQLCPRPSPLWEERASPVLGAGLVAMRLALQVSFQAMALCPCALRPTVN